MFILVFLILLGTVVTVKSAQPDVEMYSELYDVGTEVLLCRARHFNTTDIILNIKKNRIVQTKEDGVETSGVKPHEDGTFWREDSVIISTSDMYNYSCEVSHAASRFRVEKVWDPDSGGRGRIISSKFIDTSKPQVETFTINSTDHDNVFLKCQASGFYPNNITVNIRRNGRILTRDDGVESSGVRPNEDDTFSRTDDVGILKSDKANYSCEVIHAASGSRVKKVWDKPDVEMFIDYINSGTEVLLCRAKYFNTADIILNIKKNRIVQTKEDGVETSGVKPHEDGTFWREDHVVSLKSDMSDYSCEVIHAASRFRVEKVWDPDSGGRGRIISSKFIDTSPPHVETFTANSTDHDNVFLTCLASGFYPNNISLNIKRNGRILTRDDGVVTPGVRPNEDDTFSRTDYVEIKKSDKSDYTCEVIHAASGSHVKKVWDQPDVHMFALNSEDHNNVFLTCLASGFYPEDISLNIRRNGRLLTREDGVKTSDVRPNGDDTFQGRVYVEIKKSDKSDYRCEVIHDASGSHVEKVWDHRLPLDSDGDNTVIIIGAVVGGLVLVLVLAVVLVVLKKRGFPGAAAKVQEIYAKYTSVKPDVETFTMNSTDHNNVLLTCVARGFYPKDITLNIKRNGRILTKEDGVKTSGARPHGGNTFHRIDYVEVLESDVSDYSCEVIHAASGFHVKKVWGAAVNNAAVTYISEAPPAEDSPPGKTESKWSLDRKNSFDSGVAKSERSGSIGSGSQISTCSDSVNDDTTSRVEADGLLNRNIVESEVSINISS